MSSKTLSLVIVNDHYLADRHLDYLIDTLNQQTCQDFHVFWINQQPTAMILEDKLEGARFSSEIHTFPYPFIHGVCCWEIPQSLHHILSQPTIGDYFVYLHKECLLEPHFVETLLAGIATTEKSQGFQTVYMLNQLRTPLTVAQLNPQTYLEALQTGDLQTWALRFLLLPVTISYFARKDGRKTPFAFRSP